MKDQLKNNKDYKYLVFKANGRINQKELKKAIVGEEYQRRVQKILSTRLNCNNIISAIKSYAVPELT